jgi:hypothetical protein
MHGLLLREKYALLRSSSCNFPDFTLSSSFWSPNILITMFPNIYLGSMVFDYDEGPSLTITQQI